MQKVKEVINEYLKPNDTVILGLSGGPDSMCLLSLLTKSGINVIIAHVNHKVRKESDKEEEYIKKYAQNGNIICHTLTLAQSEENFENYARKQRYIFFKELLEKYHAKYIVTAHHADDEIETILMRLTRGSNLGGYAGIKILDNLYFRPLLYATKDEILKYNEINNISYFIDHTNNENDHTRNRFRHHILPFLKKENPMVHQKFLEYSKKLIDADNFITKYIESLHLIENHGFKISKFAPLDLFIKETIIELIIKDYQKDFLFDVSKHNIKDILALINNRASTGIINLKNGFIAVKEYDNFYITKDKEKNTYKEKFSHCFQNDMFIIKLIKEEKDCFGDTIFLDSSEITLPLIIRSKEDGDKIEIKNLGHQKISDIFINMKVPPHLRSTYPIVTDSNNNVLWIPNLKKSKFAKDKKQKYDIILSSERNNNYE